MRSGRQNSETFSNVREEEFSLFLKTGMASEELMVAKSLSFCYFVRTMDAYFDQVPPFLSLAPEQTLRLHPSECIRGRGLGYS